MKIPQSYKLWEIKYTSQWSIYDTPLWVLGDSAEVAARKTRRFLKKQGNTFIKITGVRSNGTIDIF